MYPPLFQRGGRGGFPGPCAGEIPPAPLYKRGERVINGFDPLPNDDGLIKWKNQD